MAVKVTSRARRPGLGGVAADHDGGRLLIGMSRATEGGRANRAVCVVPEETLDVAPSMVAVASGATNRCKMLHVAGDPGLLAARLAAL